MSRSLRRYPRSQTRPKLEALEARTCPVAGSTLATIGSGPGYTLEVNTYGRVAAMVLDPAEYATWANGSETQADTEAMTRRIYASLPDDFDFIFLENNEAALRPDAAFFGLYRPARNDTTGLAQSTFNNANDYGSAGDLQGVIHLTQANGLSGGPSLHELLHRWANYLPEINGGDPTHWGFSSVGGQLGGFQYGTLEDLGGGNYQASGPGGRATFGANANGGNSIPYSPLELYAMGLIGPESVTDPIQVAHDAAFTGDIRQHVPLQRHHHRHDPGHHRRRGPADPDAGDIAEELPGPARRPHPHAPLPGEPRPVRHRRRTLQSTGRRRHGPRELLGSHGRPGHHHHGPPRAIARTRPDARDRHGAAHPDTHHHTDSRPVSLRRRSSTRIARSAARARRKSPASRLDFSAPLGRQCRAGPRPLSSDPVAQQALPRAVPVRSAVYDMGTNSITLTLGKFDRAEAAVNDGDGPGRRREDSRGDDRDRPSLSDGHRLSLSPLKPDAPVVPSCRDPGRDSLGNPMSHPRRRHGDCGARRREGDAILHLDSRDGDQADDHHRLEKFHGFASMPGALEPSNFKYRASRVPRKGRHI